MYEDEAGENLMKTDTTTTTDASFNFCRRMVQMEIRVTRI